MKKKLLSVILTLFILVGLMSVLSVSASAANIGTITGTMQDTSDPENTTVNWSFSYNRYEGTATLTLSGTGYMPNAIYEDSWLIAQSEVQCYVTELIVKDGVRSIMENAFMGEAYLKEVTLPDSIEYIGEGAFAYTAIESFYIPEKVDYLNSLMFIGSPIKSFTVSPNNEYYKAVDGFVYSKDMTELVIAPSGKWKNNANYSYTIPSTVTTIMPYAFINVSINSITIPSNVKVIKQMAFYGAGLSRLYFQNGIEMLYDSVFLDCKKLTVVHLPTSLKYVGSYTFGFKNEIDYASIIELLNEKGISYQSLNENNVEDYVESMGYTIDQFYVPQPNQSFQIYAPDNSAGAKYATDNGMKHIRSQALTPTVTSVTTSNGGMLVKWTQSSDATGYYLYRKNLSGTWERIAIVRGVSNTSYLDTGAYAGKTNTYTVRAYNAAGQSYCYQTGASGVYVPTPKVTSVANNVGGLRVNWNKLSGASSYHIFRMAPGQYSWQHLTTISGSVSTYLDKAVGSNNRYYYTVQAVVGSVTSGYDNTGVSAVYVSAPNFSVYNITNGVAIKWSHGYTANSFRIYRKVNGGSWQLIKTANGSETVYYDKSVTRGTAYTYTVRAVYNSSVSCYEPAGKSIVSINAPLTLKTENRVSGVMVSWNKCLGAKGYHVYRRTAGGSFVRVASVSGINTLQYLDTKAQSGVTYYYTVRAYNGSSLSTYDTTGKAQLYVYTPRLSSAQSTKTGVVINYTYSSKCDGYYVYRKTPSSGWVRIATVQNPSTLSYTDKTAQKGTTYIYTVKAYKGAVMSSYFANGIEIKDKY
ncbi:MAG: leucine-rich repeat protein [Clostridia bacterium]|nr:leucine-rich repeat protein [Clostridia bacterium]